MAINAIDKKYINRTQLSKSEIENLDFYIGWIKGNDNILKQQYGEMRLFGVSFSLLVAIFCFYVFFYVRKSNKSFKLGTPHSGAS